MLAKLRLKRLYNANRILSLAMISWYGRLKKKKNIAAIKIQSAQRRHMAIKLKECLIFGRRCRKMFIRYFGRIKAKVRLANIAQLARKQEEKEREEMQREDVRMRLHIIWWKQEQRRLIKHRLEAIEKKKNSASTCIQARIRGNNTRLQYANGKRAVIHLQVNYLL